MLDYSYLSKVPFLANQELLPFVEDSSPQLIGIAPLAVSIRMAIHDALS